MILGEVIEVERARVKTLVDDNIIPKSDGDKILSCLEELKREPKKLLEYSEAEDVFEAIELYLQDRIGSAAGWFSLGRSRNDHIAAILRLKTKKYIARIMLLIIKLRRTLIEKARIYASTLFPAYTHTREAQPITFGHYLLSIDEELEDHLTMLEKTLEIVDVMPLGAGAVGGTTVNLDRDEIAKELGFARHSRNTLYMVSSRGFLILPLGIVTSLLAFLSRITQDLIILSMSRYGVIKIPNKHTATSSIMPHKVNPVTLEILRARAGESLGLFTSILDIYRATPSGYNLDFQEINRISWRIFDNAVEGLTILHDLFNSVEIDEKRSEEISRDPELLTADLAEILSIEKRIPHREAHRIIASKIREKGSRGLLEEYPQLKDVMNFLEKKRFRGSPKPEEVKKLANEKEIRLREYEERLSELLKQAGTD